MFLFKKKKSRIDTEIIENIENPEYLEINSLSKKVNSVDTNDAINAIKLTNINNINNINNVDAEVNAETYTKAPTTITVTCCSSVFNIETLYNERTCPNCNVELDFFIEKPKKNLIDTVYKSYKIKYIDFILNLNYLLVYCSLICTQVYKVFGHESRSD
jgi:hypothetical protein